MTALRIKSERPDYELLKNNCQNFARYLVEEISPGSFCPKTIKHVFEEWTTIATDSKRRLPGAYPNSIISTITESGMYFTAREEFDDATSSSQRRIMSVFLDESASGILLMLSDPNVSVMTVSIESDEEEITSVLLDESASGIFLILSDSNISVMTVSMNNDEEEIMSESASGVLLILSDPNVSVMTVSRDSDEEDSMSPALNDLSLRGDQMDSEIVPGWDTSVGQARWDLIKSSFPPDVDLLGPMKGPVELCDEFKGVIEPWNTNKAILHLYQPETNDVIFQPQLDADIPARPCRYICVLTKERRVFLVSQEVSADSKPSLKLFSVSGQLCIVHTAEHSGPQRRVSVLFLQEGDRSQLFVMHFTPPNMISTRWTSAFARYRFFGNISFIIRPVKPQAFSANRLESMEHVHPRILF